MKIFRTIKDLYFSKFPPYIVFFVTSRCNSRCKMCFYWKEIKESDKKKELTIEEIKKISQNMPRFYSLAISGGEPFLRPDLAEICKAFITNNKIRHLSIPTNGLLGESILRQTEEICKFSQNTRVEIEFSIEGLAEIHDEIRGVENNFKITLSNMRALMALEKNYLNLKIKINTTFSKYNQEYLYEFIDFLKDVLRLDRTNISLLHGQARLIEAEDYDINLYEKIVDYLIKRQIVSKSIGLFDILMISVKHEARSLLVKAVRQKKYPLKCRALKKFIVIRETGTVYPCEPIARPIGNLREYDYSLPRLLDSNEGKDYKRTFNAHECFCTWGCSVLNNILYSPLNLLRVFLISLKYKFTLYYRKSWS